jgi:CRISPR-associated protein Cas6
MLDLVFPVIGTTLPTDHAYQLYAALCGLLPVFHVDESPMRFACVTGEANPDGDLRLGDRSILRVRLADDAVKLALPLAGRNLTVGDSTIRLGVPSVRTLEPAASLVARIVTFKNADTPEQFLVTARRKLADLGVAGEPQLPIHLSGERAGEPKRRVVRIKGVTITGYATVVAELSAEHSLVLQEKGLGGRTHMGCGFFSPAKLGGP